MWKQRLVNPSLNKGIENFEARQYWAFFRFTKDDLYKLLLEEMHFEAAYTLPNGARMGGEEILKYADTADCSSTSVRSRDVEDAATEHDLILDSIFSRS